MEEAELQEIMDLLEDADASWDMTMDRCVTKQEYSEETRKRERFSSLVTRLVEQHRQPRATVDPAIVGRE